ncbi:RNA methyltransferase [Candidatus Magnetomonas plexicatena]|uniref:RNA methyltransferase n=1 Tax=Candidatus Magnetomonas plexicatena TaxID=2552947 RepID=UPI001C781595|nr:RNA methyltransferase [Nitrospirales bacterium LBB_01]
MNKAAENIYFVLIEPKEPGNIGASARAIKNMGFSNLVLVNPEGHLTMDAYLFAHGAEDVLEQAVVCTGLEEAVGQMHLVIGLSRRFGKTRGVFMPIAEAAKTVLSSSSEGKVALLFGRENNGLNNKEVESCGFIAFIPTSTAQPSLNLAQAVLLTAYELSNIFVLDSAFKVKPKATTYQLNQLYDRIESTLNASGYGSRGSQDLRAEVMRNIKHLLGRCGIMVWEVDMIHGILSHINNKILEEG